MQLQPCPITRTLLLILFCLTSIFQVQTTLAMPPAKPDQTTRMDRDNIRHAVWAGKFYPGSRDELEATIARLIREARQAETRAGARDLKRQGALRALIFPHAGYQYSGIVAARSAIELEDRHFSTVILMGPDHRAGFGNVALTEKKAFETPLGLVKISPKADFLRQNRLFRPVTRSDQTEHSLEVVLPFLQYMLGDFEMIPLVVGPCDYNKVAEAIIPLLDNKTLLAVSSDLSHYLPYDSAVKQDHGTIDIISRLDPHELSAHENRACGVYALKVLMTVARTMHWKPRLLMYKNSGDTWGNRSGVVGYASIAFYEQDASAPGAEGPHAEDNTRTVAAESHEKQHETGMEHLISESSGRALLNFARSTVENHFGIHKISLPAELDSPELKERRGTFVTITKHGTLRGCIGNIMPIYPITESVKRNAINAAFNDFRFQPLQKEELDDVTFEVSILTRPVPLVFSGPDDLISKLRPGISGVIIRSGNASATYLPQVWEQLPDPDEFLSRLCLKAGLSPDAWKTGKVEVQTYRVQYFREKQHSPD